MALPPAEQIWWGTGFENILDFDYPRALDVPRTWRRPGPGSARARNAAGTTDAAIYGYDYLLAAKARWFNRNDWDTPTGLQAFLDWAGQGNAFRFVPDKNVPDFYVDNCYLDTPFDDIEPTMEEADGSQSVDFVIRNSSKSFGEAMRGIMFEYAPGMSLTDPNVATFVRATAATRRGLPGSLLAAIGASEIAGALRDRHYDGATRTALLEASRVQLVPDPENFGAWTQLGTCARTSGQADPFGGTAAYMFDSNTPAAGDGFGEVVAFTGDGTKVLLCFLRQDNASVSQIGLRDVTAGTYRHLVNVTWTAGVPALTTASGAGTLFTPINWGAGWWLIAISANSVVAANTNRFDILPDSTGSGAHVFAFGANAWNALYPGSYQGPSLTTRNYDRFLWTMAPTNRQIPFAAYLAFYERGMRLGTPDGSGANVAVQLGTSPERITLEGGGGSGNYTFSRFHAAGNYGATRPVATDGQFVELLGILRPTFTAQLIRAFDGGAESASGETAGVALAANYGSSDIYLGSINGSTNGGLLPLARVKLMVYNFGNVNRDTIAKARSA